MITCLISKQYFVAAQEAELPPWWRVLFTQVVSPRYRKVHRSEKSMSSVEMKVPEADRGLAARTRAWVEGLGPYQSLLLLAVPVCVVEPMKLVAVAVAGDGHWITGTGMIIAAYAASLLLIERLFRIVKPKLLLLPWFAAIWVRFVALRAKVLQTVGWARDH
jgi:hypothetical protein